ncbi:MAG: hypothetical protein J1F12_08795 [Muribaculaceae bacterium]|nr:hypothetical protein [Muribaculaceae bacterium]
MKRLLIYISLFVSLFVTSCKDELSLNTGSENPVDDSMLLSFKIDTPESRTRAIDMSPGAAVYINKVWVGIYIYDYITNGQRDDIGRRVGGSDLENEINLNYRPTASGSTFYNVIPIELYQNRPTIWTNDTKLVVVGVANYEGVRTTDDKDLFEALKEANTWEKFKNIAIDKEKSNFQPRTPLLMGYLSDEKTDESAYDYIYTQVDQSSTRNIEFYGTATKTNNDKSGSLYVNINTATSLLSTGKLLKFRRLLSSINVNLTTRDDQMSITSLEYKVVNEPKSSFLAQRKSSTDNNESKSPNHADQKEKGYITLDEAQWQKPIEGNYSFSFEHLENIHTAKSEFPYFNKNKDKDGAAQYISENYHLREQKNEDGSLKYLANSKSDWNNNASYFVMRIGLKDFNTGRNSVIEYTIHEGFCNDSDGRSLVDNSGDTDNKLYNNYETSVKTRLKDYSCYRNTEYNYNVKINSVDDIVLTVTQNKTHPHDQYNGNVWEMHYPKFTSPGATDKNNRIVTAKDVSINLESPIDLTKNEDNQTLDFEDIAFRLVGSFFDNTTMQEVPVDLCYNFAHGELEGFSGLWADPVTSITEYFVTTTTEDNEGGTSIKTTALDAMDKYFSQSHPNAEEMLSRITVNAGSESDPLNIRDFIKKLNANEVSRITGVNVKGLQLYEKENESDGPRNHMIGLYVFDRQRAIEGGDRVKYDGVDCHYYRIQAIEQYPLYLTKENFVDIYASGGRISANGNNNVQINNQTIVNGGTSMILSENPDIAFRLIGYYNNINGEGGQYYDLCYNFDMKEYPYFNDYMPGISSATKTVTKYSLPEETIPQELLDGIRIKEGENGTPYTIRDFVNKALSGEVKSGIDYRFVLNKYNRVYYREEDKDDNIRALYIFDKKNRFVKPVLYNETDNEATYQFYIIEQDALYQKPTKLEVPNGGWYTHYAKYNIIEEFVGDLNIPLISGLTYNVDYYYNVRVLTTGAGNKDVTNKVEIPDNLTGGTFTYKIPMHMVHRASGNISVQAIAINPKYDDSDPKNLGSTTELTNPTWDFRSTAWYNIYTTWKTYEANKYTQLTGTEATYQTADIPRITLKALGDTRIEGSIQTNNYFIYINNGLDNCGLFTPFYKPCKVYIIAGPYDEKGNDGKRGIRIKGGGKTEEIIYNSTAAKDYGYVNMDPGTQYNSELKIGIVSGGGNLYQLKLTD